jgi:hypothetical protein
VSNFVATRLSLPPGRSGSLLWPLLYHWSDLFAVDGLGDCCAAVADESGDVFECDAGGR